MNEISSSIIGQINAAHAEFEQLGTVTAENIVQWVNKGREVGIYLDTLRAQESHWEQMDLGVEVGRAKILMRISDKASAPVNNFQEAMELLKDCGMVQGMLPMKAGHGKQQLKDRNAVWLLIKHAAEIQACYNKSIRDEMPGWGPDKRRQVRDQLRPVVEIYEALA